MLNGVVRVIALAALVTVTACAPAVQAGAPGGGGGGNGGAMTSQTTPSSPPADPGPALGASFPVNKGATVRLEAPNVTVGYQELVEDSRCKPGNVCVWEGDAKVKVSVTVAKAAPQILELHSNKKFTTAATAGPYRVEVVDLDVDAKVLTLKVTQAG
ncbi:hypothetical protein [Alloactinosynnema sp. L-07]|uniref:hypothetical protein n=1 Tax=Alloactinosynnema sp. L-07 TaxID=1653480 RepID=UPI00065EF980|nr:hypothetical protein [Alloactinosynnema sp. L-07]CRK58479.1 hypothetical protein [Alloactinosynnema sp. L-07]